MKYSLPNGKTVNIPDEEIQKNMKILELSENEAIQMWLEDNEYELNEEQAQLDKKAKAVRIDHGACGGAKKTERAPRKIEASDAKKQIFSEIWAVLSDLHANSARIEKENKLIVVEFGGKVFKVDLIEQREKKK